jgi:hypothetical protein
MNVNAPMKGTPAVLRGGAVAVKRVGQKPAAVKLSKETKSAKAK